MVFTSVAFVFAFLPVVVLAHLLLVGTRPRNLFLLLASLVFYAFGSGPVVLLLVATTLVDWAIARAIGRAHDRVAEAQDESTAARPRAVRWLVALSITGNLAVLGWFKYAGFLSAEVLAPLARSVGAAAPPAVEVLLPIGISFFTFQRMSHVIDVARRRAEPLARPTDLLLYVALFPQLVAGPIVRFHDLRDQLLWRKVTVLHLASGAVRFAHGFAKKVLVADTVAVLADTGFLLGEAQTFAGAWLAVGAYTVQLYFDFSGYSDMAIGLGTMLGFRFPENFRRPYSAVSVTDFWRRWHITLSTWFRDYLYVPLGGSRRSRARTYANLGIVFLLTGLWHGAAWTFVAWGAWHGAFLVLERLAGHRPVEGDDVPLAPLARLWTLLVVVFGWVLFRADDLPTAAALWAAMVTPDLAGLPTELAAVADPAAVVALVVGLLTVLLPGHVVLGQRIVRGLEPVLTWDDAAARHHIRPFRLVWQAGTVSLVFAASLVLVLSRTFQPFLYFRF